MSNNVPGWAPRRPLIVSDPSKLSYFARANATRSGLAAGAAAGAAGAAFGGMRVSGFGNAPSADDWSTWAKQQPQPTIGGSTPVEGARDVTQGGQTVADFFDRLSRATGSFFSNSTPPAATTVINAPSPGPLGIPIGGWVLGGIVVLGIGFVALKK